ncbi:MAG: F0F1 ATP synthase subunit B [Pirellulales bacterium]|nr:F0F1 ATP synthase subunit B [Pirellulales bacterium]
MLDPRKRSVWFAVMAVLGLAGVAATPSESRSLPMAEAVDATDSNSATSGRGATPADPSSQEGNPHGRGGEHEQDLGHGNASQDLENAAEFRSDLAIYTFTVFVLLLLILGKFAWPPISKALEERERHIAANIAAAEAKLEEAKVLYAQHEAKLADTATEVRALLEEARRNAERTKSQIIAEAKMSAKIEHDRVMRDIDHAVDVAKRELAEQSTDLVIQLASKVVQEKLTPEHQARITREALARFTRVEPSQN